MTPEAERQWLVDQLERSAGRLRDILWQLAGEPPGPERRSAFLRAVATFWACRDLAGRLRMLDARDADRLAQEWLGLSP